MYFILQSQFRFSIFLLQKDLYPQRNLAYYKFEAALQSVYAMPLKTILHLQTERL